MDNENVLNVLRSIINDYGRKYNMTPTEIAKKCDIGRSTIFYIAAGNYKSSVTQKIIDKINKENNYDNKSMQIKITDQKLLEKTGGIIQGMSGSPVIQNGKFVGAVTHVFVP